jgi:hypothetical protein
MCRAGSYCFGSVQVAGPIKIRSIAIEPSLAIQFGFEIPKTWVGFHFP